MSSIGIRTDICKNRSLSTPVYVQAVVQILIVCVSIQHQHQSVLFSSLVSSVESHLFWPSLSTACLADVSYFHRVPGQAWWHLQDSTWLLLTV